MLVGGTLFVSAVPDYLLFLLAWIYLSLKLSIFPITGYLQALSDPIDINVVSATVLVSAVLIVVGNLLVDVIYGFLDPRVTVA